jgi:hypothetical protein
MCILKGSLAGLGIFVSAVLMYIGALVVYVVYRLASAVKSGQPLAPGANWDIRIYRGFIANPWLWGALMISLAIGLWIFRMRRPV